MLADGDAVSDPVEGFHGRPADDGGIDFYDDRMVDNLYDN